MALASNVQRRVADHLLSVGLIRLDAHKSALAASGAQGTRVEDLLLDMGAVSEADLLKSVAELFSTRFVSTAKLSQANVDPRILALVPRRFAERHGVFPVLYDAQASALTVATADPDELQVFEDIKLAASVREVRPIIARPAAVRAAIAKSYQGEVTAFEPLLRPRVSSSLELNAAGPGSARVPAAPAPAAPAIDLGRPDAAPKAAPTRDAIVEAAPPASHASPTSSASTAVAPISIAPLPGVLAAPAAAPAVALRPDPLAAPYAVVRALVELLEAPHRERRGHSANVARIARRLAERLGLPGAQRDAIALAGLVHDLGKGGPQHLTALHVAIRAAHRALGMQTHRLPEAMLAPVELPAETKSALSAMYECFDGKGFPMGVSGRQIPVGARVLAVADAFAQVTETSDHPAKKPLRAPDAAGLLAKFGGKIFDPAVIDVLTRAAAGEELRAALLADRPHVLLVDPDHDARSRLEAGLCDKGFGVRLASTVEEALAEIEARPLAAVVSEIDVQATEDGVTLRTDVLPRAPDLLWMVYTNNGNQPLHELLMELDVSDVVLKATGPDAVIAGLVERLDERKIRAADVRPSQGALGDLGVAEVAEALAAGRKTCAMRLRGHHAEGVILFEDGQIVDAQLVPTSAPGAVVRGEEAFYGLMAIKEGPFRVDPAQIEGRTIFTRSTESLVAEGLRRIP